MPDTNNQIVGNIGLYYVCYRLSRRGWNVMPTARNARGIDVLIYSQDVARTHAIQVKTLSARASVPLGKTLDGLLGNFFVVCFNATRDLPSCAVLTPPEVRTLAARDSKGSYWLQATKYDQPQFRDVWDRIGLGAPHLPTPDEANA